MNKPLIYLVDLTPDDEDYFATEKREQADELIALGYVECSREEFVRIRRLVHQRLNAWENENGQ